MERWLTWPPERQLEAGSEYLVRTKTGDQVYPREHRMSFLDRNGQGERVFNARPFAGTQTFRTDMIVATCLVGPSSEREDEKRYMNRIVRP